MKKIYSSVKSWFAGLWVVIKYDCVIFTNLVIKGAAWVLVIGLAYFFVQTMFSGNVWQSILSFCIGAIISAVIISLLITSHNAEDNMYEVAVANLQQQIKDMDNKLNDAEMNFDLMRMANQSLQKDKDLLAADIERQAGIIAELVTKHNALFIECDKLKAERIRLNTMGTSKIDAKGKIV